MSTILPTSALAQPFALSTTFLDELQPLTPLAALEPAAIAALANEALTPSASSQVDLSSVAQFQSALAQSHQRLDALHTPGGGKGAAGTQQLSSTQQRNTVTDAAQNLVAAFNLLQADSASTLTAPPAAADAPLLDHLLHSVTQPNPAADASQAAGPATLADIGITLQPAQAADHGASLALNAQALVTAYAANPQGTVALLHQTTGTFEQLGDQYAQQLSSEAAIPPLPAAVQAGVSGGVSNGASGGKASGPAPAAGVAQNTLADLALLDAFAGNATPAQSASIAGNEAAALAQLDQLDVLQHQHQLDQARDAYTTQIAASRPQGQQQEDAASAAQTLSASAAAQQQVQALADAAALTLTENAALAQQASAANPAAADAAIADAQSGVGTAAPPPAIVNPAAQAQAPNDGGAATADPLAVNPALAAAIAAYRIGGATAPVQSRPTPASQRPEPVRKVEAVEPVDSATDAPPS